jgi:hypothetical protein
VLSQQNFVGVFWNPYRYQYRGLRYWRCRWEVILFIVLHYLFLNNETLRSYLAIALSYPSSKLD